MSNIEQETGSYNGLMLGPDIEYSENVGRYDLFRQSLCSGRYSRMRRIQRRRAMYWAKLLAICARSRKGLLI